MLPLLLMMMSGVLLFFTVVLIFLAFRIRKKNGEVPGGPPAANPTPNTETKNQGTPYSGGPYQNKKINQKFINTAPYSEPSISTLPRSQSSNTEKGPDEAATWKRISDFGDFTGAYPPSAYEFKTGSDDRIYLVYSKNTFKDTEVEMMVDMNRRLGLLLDHLTTTWGSGDWRVQTIRKFVVEKYSRLGQGPQPWGRANNESVFFSSVVPGNSPWYTTALDPTWFEIIFDAYLHEMSHVLCYSQPRQWDELIASCDSAPYYEGNGQGHGAAWATLLLQVRTEAQKAGLRSYAEQGPDDAALCGNASPEDLAAGRVGSIDSCVNKK